MPNKKLTITLPDFIVEMLDSRAEEFLMSRSNMIWRCIVTENMAKDHIFVPIEADCYEQLDQLGEEYSMPTSELAKGILYFGIKILGDKSETENNS